MKVRHPAVPYKANLHVLNVLRTLKGAQLELSAPELDERQAHPRENQSLDLDHRQKALKHLVTLGES